MDHFIRQFCVVAKEKNITRASKRLYISQPALSKNMKILEQHLGVSLFIRKPQGIELTRYGEILWQHGTLMNSVFQNALNNIKQLKTNQYRDIRIGCGYMWIFCYITTILNNYYKKESQIHVHLQTGFSHNLIEQLLEDQCHFILCQITNEVTSNTNLHYKKLTQTRILIYANETHPLHNKQNLTLDDLKKCNHVNLISNDNSGSLFSGLEFNELTHLPNIILSSTNAHLCLQVASEQNALICVAQLPDELLKNYHLKAFNFLSNSYFDTGIVYTDAVTKTPYIMTLIDDIIGYFENKTNKTDLLEAK